MFLVSLGVCSFVCGVGGVAHFRRSKNYAASTYSLASLEAVEGRIVLGFGLVVVGWGAFCAVSVHFVLDV